MAGYIGSKASVTQVDGYTKTEADARYVEGDDTLYVDQTNNQVGIGTSSPARDLVVSNSSQANIALQTTASGSTLTDGFQIQADGSHAYLWNYENTNILLGTNNTERMRIDSSGNLLVGKTAIDSSVAGFEVDSDGKIAATRDGSQVAIFNRLTSDGDIATFRKDGTTVGSIGVAGINSYFSTGDTGLLFAANVDAIIPTNQGSTRDNVIDLGNSANRFDDIYATNGTIQTSDRNEKQDIEVLSDAEQRVAVAAKGLLRKFRWKADVEERGDSAEIYFGIIAQDLKSAFEAEGLDADQYGVLSSKTWTNEETGEEHSRLSVHYSGLLAFIISAI